MWDIGTYRILTRRICMALVCVHAFVFLALVIGGYWLVDVAVVGGRGVIGIASVSAIVALGALVHPTLRADRRVKDWAIVLLVLNVMPYAVLVVIGMAMGF